ncbi:protein of unknown function [Devosia sp. YR412]|uniref:DUF4282 domain-containing protein n=1 Tax=Devosia sp. YR412 TaxID=1881030 RepID=UPI0008B489F0|nr:DUF4282 domain-containing protein [Devosia sp. YR412]SEQ42362.1 protein of unknown function [Devosia sp. YR412]
MTLDDLKRLFTRQTLFKLDAILSPKLVPILYALGLAAILLWAVSHLFWSFGFGFGNVLWGLLEIVVFGLISFVSLRILCEALLVWFRTHESSGETVTRSRYSASLLDEVRDAIRDLAEEGDDLDYAEADEYITSATEPAPYVAPTTDAPRAPATSSGEVFAKPRRTAKRTPPPKNVT